MDKMNKKVCLFLVFMVFYFLPCVGFAQVEAWDWAGGAKGALRIIFGPDIPAEFTKDAFSVLQWLIFPFFALWVVMFGILSEIRIFRRKMWINSILAFLIAAISGPTGGLVYTVKVMFTIAGWLGFVFFGVLLIIGIFLWFASTIWFEWRKPGKGIKGAVEKFNEIQKLEDHIQFTKDQLLLSAPGTKESEELTKELIRLADLLEQKRKEV